MSHNYDDSVLAQLRYGAGRTLLGDTGVIVLKALLESGVSYVGGYPGSPVTNIYDATAGANHDILKPLGIYFQGSGNEASAASMLKISINHPVRGAVIWKVVGSNVAADPLAHIASSGVKGGVLVFVGEDYGCSSTSVAETTLTMGLKSGLIVIDPPVDAQRLHWLIQRGFEMSEASQMPAAFLLRTRVGNMKGSIICGENREPTISRTRPLEKIIYDITRDHFPPYSVLQERSILTERLPLAAQYALRHELNQLFPGTAAGNGKLRAGGPGIITHGMVLNTLRRVLAHLGRADATGKSDLSILNLNVLHPLIPEQVLDFLRGHPQVLIIEEGAPTFLEQQIRVLAQKEKLDVELYGTDILPPSGERVPAVVLRGVEDFLGRAAGNGKGPRELPRSRACEEHVAAAAAFLKKPPTPRLPIFCSGCPERPIFSALTLLREQFGSTEYGNDIGCYSMGALPPHNLEGLVTGMGTGLAASTAMGVISGQRPIAFMGDGTFWHSGLTTSVVNAIYDNLDAVLVIFDNLWTAMTGHQENPSSHRNIRGEAIPRMQIEETLRGMGVTWLRTVNPYDMAESYTALREAFQTPEGGLKVVVSRAECELERTRRERIPLRLAIQAGERKLLPRLGVDPDVCTGDHSCMRFNGCPSLTLKENPNPLRQDEVAHIDQSCTGCGFCGELAHTAILCPSFYRVEVIENPTAWDKLRAGLRRAVIGRLWRWSQPAPGRA